MCSSATFHKICERLTIIVTLSQWLQEWLTFAFLTSLDAKNSEISKGIADCTPRTEKRRL